MLAAKIDVCFVSSTTVITETSELSFSSATKSLVIGASARRNACGARTSTRIWRSLKPSVRAASSCTRRHGLERAAIDLAFVRGVVQPETEQRRQKRRQLDERRKTEIQDEQLQQQRRAADHLDVGGQRDAQRAVAVDAAARDQHADDHGQRHRQARQQHGDQRRVQERGQIPARRLPRLIVTPLPAAPAGARLDGATGLADASDSRRA